MAGCERRVTGLLGAQTGAVAALGQHTRPCCCCCVPPWLVALQDFKGMLYYPPAQHLQHMHSSAAGGEGSGRYYLVGGRCTGRGREGQVAGVREWGPWVSQRSAGGTGLQYFLLAMHHRPRLPVRVYV